MGIISTIKELFEPKQKRSLISDDNKYGLTDWYLRMIVLDGYKNGASKESMSQVLEISMDKVDSILEKR